MMEQLRRILEQLKDPRWVMRPMAQEQAQVNAQFPDNPAPKPGQPGIPSQGQGNPNAAIKPAALDSMITSLDAQQQGDKTPVENSPETPFRKKMRYLDIAGQNQKQNFPNMQKRPVLGGGGLSEFGIY